MPIRSLCPQAAFEYEFEQVFQKKMKGLPICRSDLRVRALGFQSYREHWIGALVTPWSVLIVFTSGNQKTWPTIQEGKITTVNLPGGPFSFLGMRGERVGTFLACSLMSPIERMFNQRNVEDFALKALTMMLTPLSEDTQNKSDAIPKKFSRRDFFQPFSQEMK